MGERQWIPRECADEGGPATRASPDDWITPLPGDAYGLASGDEAWNAESEPRILTEGETVGFWWCESQGSATFEIKADSTWAVDPEPSPDVTHIWSLCDPESLGFSMQEFAEGMIRVDSTPDEFQIEYATWSKEDVLFRFEGGKFVGVVP